MNDWKEKFAIAIAVVLVFFFVTEITAEASERLPSYELGVVSDLLDIPEYSNNFKFYIGADSIFIDNNDVFISYSSGNASFSLDVITYQGYHDLAGKSNKFDFIAFYGNSFNNVKFNYTDNGFDTFIYNIEKKPYVIFDGIKHYLSSVGPSMFVIDPSVAYVNVIFGIEIDCNISFDAKSVSSEYLKTFFGSADINVISSGDYLIYGYRYISTGDNVINDSIKKSNSFLDTISSTLSSWKNVLTVQITNWQEALSTQMLSLQTSLSNKLDEVIKAITQNYDTTESDKALSDVEDTLSKVESADAVIRNDAVKNLDSFTIPADGFTGFGTEVVNAINLCSSMLQSIYASAGNFNVIISVTFALLISSMVLGLFRFALG